MTDFAPGLDHCFFFDATEDSYLVDGVEGTLPSDLRGVYYANGPSRFERAGQRYRHWLDGDGLVHRLSFTDEGVRHTTRFVDSLKSREEAKAGRFLYRAFGTSFADDLLRRSVMLESPVNVSVYPFDGKLLAFGEQTLPRELDPETLETTGDFDFGGKLNEISPVSAHPKIDPNTGHLVVFGIAFSSRPTLHMYEFDPGEEVLRRRRHRMDAHYSLHDFNLSPGYMVFHLGPLILDIERFLGQGNSIMESLDWRPETGSKLLIVPRSRDAGEPFEVEVEPKYCLHHINAFEQDGCLIVDLIEIDEPIYRHYQILPELFVDAPPARPVRYAIDLASNKVVERTAFDYERCPDFPAVTATDSCRPYDRFWMLGMSQFGPQGRKFFDELVGLSWADRASPDIYRPQEGYLLGGQPACVERPGKQPLVIVQELDPANRKAWYVVLDGLDLKRGPLARIPLRHWIHASFHTYFDPAPAVVEVKQ